MLGFIDFVLRPDGEPHILMDFLTLLGPSDGMETWKRSQVFVSPPVEVLNAFETAEVNFFAIFTSSSTCLPLPG